MFLLRDRTTQTYNHNPLHRKKWWDSCCNKLLWTSSLWLQRTFAIMFLLCSTVCESRPLTPPLLLLGPPSCPDYGWQPGTQPTVNSDCFMPSLCLTSASPFQMPSLTFNLATKLSGVVIIVIVQITMLFYQILFTLTYRYNHKWVCSPSGNFLSIFPHVK